MKDLKSKIYRTVIFVRHGQTQYGPEKLTPVGCRQAELAAEGIRPLKPSKLYSSTMPRARETAGIIGAKIKLKFLSKRFFCEGFLPGTQGFFEKINKECSPTEMLKIRKKAKTAELHRDKAFDFIFKIPTEGQSCEVVIAHGNVIRHWVCKSLKIDPAKNWKALDVMNASLTAIRIDDKGKLVLLRFSDVGHLPYKMRTYA